MGDTRDGGYYRGGARTDDCCGARADVNDRLAYALPLHAGRSAAYRACNLHLYPGSLHRPVYVHWRIVGGAGDRSLPVRAEDDDDCRTGMARGRSPWRHARTEGTAFRRRYGNARGRAANLQCALVPAGFSYRSDHRESLYSTAADVLY